MPQLQQVTFPSASSEPIQLEGMLHAAEGEGPRPAAVICHPHPLGGGNMHNRVVSTLARSLAASGVTALRFNFRGVERSGGSHDYGRGERADVAGALDWLQLQPQVDLWRLSVVGYSFGAWVGLAHAQGDLRVVGVAAVGLTAWHFDADFARSHVLAELGTDRWEFDPDFLQSFARPKLFVAGEFDDFAPLAPLRRLVDGLPSPKVLHIVRGSDHFMQGYEVEVGNVVAEFVAGL
jgi:alpha/beta superfamily hydrolase